MSLHKSNDITTVQIKKRYISDGTAQKQVKKKYKSDGTRLVLTYTAEEIISLPATGKIYQYESWGSVDTSAFNASGFSSMWIDWDIRTQISWSDANGANGTVQLFLVLADGTEINFVNQQTATLWVSGNSTHNTGENTVDISSYSDSQKESCKLRLKAKSNKGTRLEFNINPTTIIIS